MDRKKAVRSDIISEWAAFYDLLEFLLFLQNKRCKYFQKEISVNFAEK